MSRRTPSTRGTVRAKAHTSDTGWASCTPSSPQIWGRASTAGMKNSPCRTTASTEACQTLLMVWVSMLEMTMTPHSGKARHCNRRARAPKAMTSGSLRNTAMIWGARTRPRTETAVRNTVDHLTQKRKPSFTR